MFLVLGFVVAQLAPRAFCVYSVDILCVFCGYSVSEDGDEDDDDDDNGDDDDGLPKLARSCVS